MLLLTMAMCKRKMLEVILILCSLSITISLGDMSIFGLFEDKSNFDDVQSINAKMNMTKIGYTLNWNASHGLSHAVSQIEELKTRLEKSVSSTNFVLSDVHGMQGEMIKELLQIAEDSKSSYYSKTVLFDDSLGGLPRHCNQVATDMVTILESLKLPFKDVTVITDKTDISQATMTHLVHKINKGGRYNVRIANAEKLITEHNSITSIFVKSKIMLIDCDGVLFAKLVQRTKSMGLTGLPYSVKWIMSKRTLGSLPQGFFVASGEYYAVQTHALVLNASAVLKKAMECDEGICNVEDSIQSDSVARQQPLLPIQNIGLWNGLTSVPNNEELISIIASKRESRGNLPRLRVSVCDQEPFITVSECKVIWTDMSACHSQGRLGIRRRTNATDVLVCLHGFTIDILNELEDTLGFVGIPMLTKDGNYGTFNERTGVADGIVGEIARNETDIAIDLYADHIRSQVISFSTPFYDEAIGLGYMQANVYGEARVSKPFSLELWLSIIFCIVLLFFGIWILERLSPYGQHQVNKRCLDEKEPFKLVYSAVYVWGTFFTGEIISKRPRSIGTRSVAIFVSCVSISVISAYSANLISFLVVLDESPLITGLLDEKLVHSSSKFQIGVEKSTYLEHFLTAHSDDRVRHMSRTRMKKYTSINAAFEALKSKNVDLVIGGFLWMEYAIRQEKSCKFKAIPINGKKVGLAISYNNKSTWSSRLNVGAIELSSSGKAEMIVNKWFAPGKCTNESKFSALDSKIMKPLFLWLFIGIAVCLCMLVAAIWLEKCLKACK